MMLPFIFIPAIRPLGWSSFGVASNTKEWRVEVSPCRKTLYTRMDLGASTTDFMIDDRHLLSGAARKGNANRDLV